MSTHSIRQTILSFATVLKKAFLELSKNAPLRMAGATAFFTTFALPPILIILIQVLGLLFNPAKIKQQLFSKLVTIIGQKSVEQVMEVLTGFRQMAQNWWITIIGFVFLIFVATTLFIVIKDSLNQLWKIKISPQKGIKVAFENRLISVLLILGTGVLFITGLLVEGAQVFIGKYISQLSPTFAFYFNSALNYLVTLIIVTIWFTVLFRFLPDGKPTWKIAASGGFITSLLFNIGKYILQWLLTYSSINTIYGASGSIVLLLLFVFYSSFTLYYGAAFTKEWGIHQQQPIQPLPHAKHYQLAEINPEDVEEYKL